MECFYLVEGLCSLQPISTAKCFNFWSFECSGAECHMPLLLPGLPWVTSAKECTLLWPETLNNYLHPSWDGIPPPQAHDQISSMWKELESVRKKLDGNSLKTEDTSSPVHGGKGWVWLAYWTMSIG